MRKLGMGLAAAVLAVSTVFGGTALKNVSQVKAADTDYTYVYAGLSWEEYWNAEGVYNASNTQSSDDTELNWYFVKVIISQYILCNFKQNYK